jgi:hypothetical protein
MAKTRWQLWEVSMENPKKIQKAPNPSEKLAPSAVEKGRFWVSFNMLQVLL